MNFTLIVCTYMRPQPLLNLLNSVKLQTVYPNEILIIDGSTNEETKTVLEQNKFPNLNYFLVLPEERGLTRQRNFGVSKVAKNSEIVCFLDDDTILEPDYFEHLLNTYSVYPDALGAGGYITNIAQWTKTGQNYIPKNNEFYFDGWKKPESKRFMIRKKFGLDSDKNPGFMPEFSNGRGVSYLPPSGKIYPVEQFMGGVASFKKEVFDTFSFSPYFEGYGLYEDADFTLRISKTGNLYFNSNARLAHYHDNSGRPNKFKYGQMVVRNGWYVWRVKYPKPSVKARVKWNLIVLLLSFILLSNVFTKPKKSASINEFFGRITAWFSLVFK
ncbi:glycosyltransferase family 2 protein [Flavobacterium wongokense]|uniref:glycosyltransferase family 2 protein n=1 Tax=Flavobacterium wongokense TaxID=2910674 RepID=UPI001F48D438|nr:glycosyltransferase family 2 protein [Flavobacterium sp. WG47]MCF6132664.1 glycosyltransferase [Flavobacterium sp. WG47]